MLNENIKQLPEFSEKFFNSGEQITGIGTGEYGGKASGLIFINEILNSKFNASEFPDFTVNIPAMTVIPTDVFDTFMQRNSLYDISTSDESDDNKALAFQKADLPFEILGDLRR